MSVKVTYHCDLCKEQVAANTKLYVVELRVKRLDSEYVYTREAAQACLPCLRRLGLSAEDVNPTQKADAGPEPKPTFEDQLKAMIEKVLDERGD